MKIDAGEEESHLLHQIFSIRKNLVDLDICVATRQSGAADIQAITLRF